MNKKVAILLEKARENVRIAQVILENGSPSIACSRAYYAMFYVAEAWLLSIGETYSSHRAVMAAFGRHFARTERVPTEQHRRLLNAFEARQVADYGISMAFDAPQAQQIIRWAEEMIRTAEDHLLQGEAET